MPTGGKQMLDPKIEERFNRILLGKSIEIKGEIIVQPERTSEKDRNKALDELVELSQEMGLYDMRCSEHSNERG